MPANLVKQSKANLVKQPKCFEDEDTKSEATPSEHEPEAEFSVLESADLSEPESQDKIDGSQVASIVPPPGLHLEPVFFPPPGLARKAIGPQLPEYHCRAMCEDWRAPAPKGGALDSPKRRATSSGNPKPQPEAAYRELGRCVCWKDSFGFIVDEGGTRLFVRQTDVEGEKALLAGQIVWFRRGVPQARQTTKALDVTLVDIEMAKILRTAEKDGMSWSTFIKAVIDGDSEVLASFNRGKLVNFKAEATKHFSDKAEATKGINDKTKGSHASGATAKASKGAPADVDLKAFLGSGSVQDMRANLKYAPQWVADKFNSQHGLAA